MLTHLANGISKYWLVVILSWLLLLVAVRVTAPRWKDVTHDGDFAYLPTGLPSVVGERLTRAAFPAFRAKSQVVFVAARPDRELDSADLQIADELARRLHNLLGVAALSRANEAAQQAEEARQLGDEARAAQWEQTERDEVELAQSALDEAIRLDERFAIAWHNRALLFQKIGLIDDFERNRRTAWSLDPSLDESPQQLLPREAAELPLVDVWTRHHDLLGSKLRSRDRRAQLLILQLSNEFMATDNIRVMEILENELRIMRSEVQQRGPHGLELGLSGSAAVGGDMLRSAAESIKNTELLTLGLVVLILLVVYRAPLLVMVPLITIAVSLAVSLGLLALLTQLNVVPGFEWWNLKVFTTTKIFIVVILFGAGTDFCLFLISRLREELARGADQTQAVSQALAAVSSALIASALTTIFGLAMMVFADFGKFSNSGPVIGLCLFVTLIACLTLAPAILRALGGAVFWPFATPGSTPMPVTPAHPPTGVMTPLWQRLSRSIVSYPGRILVVSVLLLAPLAMIGFATEGNVTFNLLSELSASRESIQGSRILARHFPVGETGPVTVLAHRRLAGFDDPQEKVEAVAAIVDLTEILLAAEGVTAVRSLVQPLGDKPKRSLFRSGSLRQRMLQEHRLTKAVFLAQSAEYKGDVTRFELVLSNDPFSGEAIETLERVNHLLNRERNRATSFWHGASFAFTGTTAGIRDLRAVTRSDARRIQILVVLAVFLVLVVILRRPQLCLYLIVSVLFSYFVTMGITELFFRWSYGDTFEGLDWKVPIFLFVILVAIGQDYNIYLVTRVFEEQQQLGPFAGLRAAIVRTGGIITSCGIIMAGTFVSMTSGTLRGIVELGFALSLGILLDTFVVRTVLVPAYLSIYCRLRASAQVPRSVAVASVEKVLLPEGGTNVQSG